MQSLLKHYYTTLFQGFRELKDSATTSTDSSNDNCWDHVILDCANGVGSLAVEGFMEVFNSHTHSLKIEIDSRNNARDGPVNELCGAELVQKNQVKPFIKGLDYHSESAASSFLNKLFCSFDGDADRIVFHGICSSGAAGNKRQVTYPNISFNITYSLKYLSELLAKFSWHFFLM